jgi:hypothetical protein
VSNQVILWSMLILPWFTLLFLKKEEIKYYMPVGIFAGFTSAIISEVGVTLGFWVNQETIYPLSQIMPFDIGLNVVLTIWVFKYTYRRFWVYLIVNTILDIGFSFFLFNQIFSSRGILYLVGISPFQSLLITLTHALLLYGYQIWQEDALLVHEKSCSFSANLHPAATKPLPEDHGNKADKE